MLAEWATSGAAYALADWASPVLIRKWAGNGRGLVKLVPSRASVRPVLAQQGPDRTCLGGKNISYITLLLGCLNHGFRVCRVILILS